MITISASVGFGGKNKPTDVALMQRILNLQKSVQITVDGLAGNELYGAIEDFQKNIVKSKKQDKRIDVHGKTIIALRKLEKKHPASLGKSPVNHNIASIDSNRFVLLYKKQYGALKAKPATALKSLITFIDTDSDIHDVRWAAYMLATAKHEVANTWLPIEEYGKGGSRSYGKAVAVKDKTGKSFSNKYYGRGYVQLTWEANYLKIGKAIGMDDALHIHPEKALHPEVAYKVMSYGMRHGTFTTKKLSNYISGQTCDYYNARRIINGLDKARLIKGYAIILEQLLRLSK